MLGSRATMSEPARNLHFMLRYSDMLFDVDTFREHSAILKKFGSVWWGKFGLGVANSVVETAKRQIARRIPTYVYLTMHANIRYRGRLVDMIGGKGTTNEQPSPARLIPSYYREKPCSVWFKFDLFEPVTETEKMSLVLYHSPTHPPQMRGMRGLVYVSRGRVMTGIPPMAKKVDTKRELLIDEEWDA